MHKTIKILLCTFLLTSLFISQNIANASVVGLDNCTKSNYSFKLEINKDFLDFYSYNSSNDNMPIIKGNKFKVGYTGTQKAWFNINIKTYQGNGKDIFVEGNAVLKIANETYPLKVEGDLENYILSDGTSAYYGPLTGYIKSRFSDEECIVSLYFDPFNNKASASLSIGTIGSEGVGMLVFGETDSNIQEIYELNNNMQIKDNETDRNLPLRSLSSEPLTEPQSVVIPGHDLGGPKPEPEDLGSYDYIKSVGSTYISNLTCNNTIEKAPPNSSISNNTRNYMEILDVFYCTGESRNVLNRVWTNTEKVACYFQYNPPAGYSNPYHTLPDVNVKRIYTWFGSTSPNIDINNFRTPPKEKNIILKYITIAASLIKYGSIITAGANLLFDWKDDYVYFDEAISKSKSSVGAKYQEGVYFQNVMKNADVLSSPSDLVPNAGTEGGLAYRFFYSKASNSSTAINYISGAQVVYYVYSIPFTGYVWSDSIQASYTK